MVDAVSTRMLWQLQARFFAFRGASGIREWPKLRVLAIMHSDRLGEATVGTAASAGNSRSSWCAESERREEGHDFFGCMKAWRTLPGRLEPTQCFFLV